jgi:hypothetical protein
MAMKMIRQIRIASLLLTFCLQALRAEEWYLPDGQIMTTQAGSTPPVSGARLHPYPNTINAPPANQVIVMPAPSISQLKDLLPKMDASQGAFPDIAIAQKFKDALDGQHGGQCAAFAQLARPDLAGFGNANKMPAKALEMGFEVNGVPRIGSVLSIEKAGGSEYGHAVVVTGVHKEDYRYRLTIKDSNASENELISTRAVYYTPSENGVFGNYGKYEEIFPGASRLAKDLVVIGFIHERLANTTN